MKVNIEAQFLCGENIRGVPYYTKNIINSLHQRTSKDFQYSVSFFDYKNQRNNRDYIQKHLLESCPDLQTYECNNHSYKEIKTCCQSDDFSRFSQNYGELLSCDADIYHFPASCNWPYGIAKNAVVTVHDIMPIIFRGKGWWTEKGTDMFERIHQYISTHGEITVIADSECTKKDLIEWLHVQEERIFVTPLGYDKNFYYPQHDKTMLQELGIEPPYLLYLGAIDMRKGIFDILEAFHIVKDKYKDVKLVMAGGTDPVFKAKGEEQLKSMPKEDVIFTGYVTDDQKRILMSSAEAFLFPSEYEGFGLPVIEAMACGTPVITTNVSSLPEVGGDAVLYVSPNQPEELAVQMERILYSSSLRQEYVAKGLKRVKLFSWDRTAALTEEVYQIAYERTH